MNEFDRDLLIYAAKAAGIQYTISVNGAFLIAPYMNPLTKVSWNPLEDDGDAFRLAVKLNISIGFGIFATQINCEIYDWAEDEVLVEWKEDGRKDPYAATRRAIVRAAAEIGRRMV